MFYMLNLNIFFFQAEDGIRDIGVTGVQTCALPIFFDHRPRVLDQRGRSGRRGGDEQVPTEELLATGVVAVGSVVVDRCRSEERRVGKECRSRWSPYH